MLFGLKDNFCVPDIDASKEKNRIWVECKRKKRMRSHPATGYPQKYHDHYRKVQEITGNKVFVVFEDDTDGTINWYGNWLDEMEKFIYRENWNIQGKPHILFKYPEAFIKINKTISSV